MRDDHQARIEFAWKVHEALNAWTAKVDTKASVVLAIEGAVIGLIVSLAHNEGALSHLHGARHARFIAGCLLLGLGAFLSGLAVFPQLGRLSARKRWSSGVIYFGHLRRWDPERLEEYLLQSPDIGSVRQLTRQHVAISKIAWRKHVWLQWSMTASAAGALVVLWAGL
jgi:hypothetical protein